MPGPAADDHTLPGHAGHAAQQHAGAPVVLGEAIRADHHGHAAGNLAHRLEQGQAAVDFDRLVGESRHAARKHRLGERFVRRQMQVGEKNLTPSQQGDLLRLGLLDLDDEVGGKRLLVRADDLGARGLVVRIRITAPGAGSAFDQHAVAALGQLIGGGGKQGDPVLLLFDFTGDSNNHRGGSFYHGPVRSGQL